MKRELLFALVLLLPLAVNAAEVNMYYFHQPGCSHCAVTEPVLEQLEVEFPDLIIEKFDIRESIENYNLLTTISNQYNFTPRETPIIFVGGDVIEYSSNIETVLREKIEEHSEMGCGCPGDEACETSITPLTLGAVLIGAFLDSINPCEFAVLIILIS